MDRRQASKKRIASTSRSSSPHCKQSRLRGGQSQSSSRTSTSSVAASLTSSSSLLLLHDNSSRSSTDDRDSGLETFISDDTFDLSGGSPPSISCGSNLRTDEKLRVDSPIIKHMEKMSVLGAVMRKSSPKKTVQTVLQVSTRVKKVENFVIGRSLVKAEPRPCDRVSFKSNVTDDMEFRVRRFYMARQDDVSADGDAAGGSGQHDKENWPGYQRSALIFEQHPEIEEDMRSILLHWMMEVSKAYCLRRRTFHMALDYVDRFLTLTENLPKSLLQLVGVASLSLAAKIEEIFPPELKEMAYVTAEAHSTKEIKDMEKLIFYVLGTAFMPITPSDCVGVYLQKAGLTGKPKVNPDNEDEHPENTDVARENQLPLKLYSEICRVIDMALLDAQSLRFSYKQVAATAVYLVDPSILRADGLTGLSEFNVTEHGDCIEWMSRFAKVSKGLPAVDDSNPCEDGRHRHHEVMWPHLQVYSFSLEDFMGIMEAKKRDAMLSSEAQQRSEENSDLNNNNPADNHHAVGYQMVDDMIERLLNDEDIFPDRQVMTNTVMSPPPARHNRTNALGSKAPPSSMFLTPPDSRRTSCASNDSGLSTSLGSLHESV
ncbi:putative G1/S-specific cyclin-E1 [Hypsibius exemplaris]|uniref:G1/S-specific cyclin-E1 n=1 Tax=Hypsibius exemplaris TaxID=2072580 RepID=A0A1W0WIQ0_HYPEX|nr:putative G1/S-specific cyclin-E1 [Hypsibius exemplaris]